MTALSFVIPSIHTRVFVTASETKIVIYVKTSAPCRAVVIE